MILSRNRRVRVTTLGQCAVTGKAQFNRRDAARLARANRQRDKGTRWAEYRCSHCNRFHIGHQAEGRR